MIKKISFALAAGLALPLLVLANVTVQFDNGGNATVTPGSSLVLTGSVTNNGAESYSVSSNIALFAAGPGQGQVGIGRGHPALRLAGDARLGSHQI